MELSPWNSDPLDLHSRLNALNFLTASLGGRAMERLMIMNVLKPRMCSERLYVCNLYADPCEAEVRGAPSTAQ